MEVKKALALAFFLLLLSGCGSQGYECDDCNVILVSIDTLRADRVGVYGHERNTTPKIDEFAKDSVVFKNTIAQAPTTTPSHASIFTSLIPPHHGAYYNRNTSISENVTLMAEILKRANYSTVSYNDWGRLSDNFGFDRGFDKYKGIKEGRTHTFQEIFEDAKPWLENHTEEKFFLFLHTYHVHFPYKPGTTLVEKFEENYTGKLEKRKFTSKKRKINSGQMNLTEEDKEHLNKLYDGEIRDMDRDFGRFIDYLKSRGLYNESMIIFLSDHGEEMGERGKWSNHGHTLYDELLKVPLIIKYPNSRHVGKEVEQQVRLLDVMPTVIETIGLRVPDQAQGVNLLKTFEKDLDLEAFSAMDREEEEVSLRTDKWKLMYDKRLFNIKEDPLERNNVYSENSEVVGGLQKVIEEWYGKDELREGVERPEFSNRTKKQLKSLGYMG